MLTRRLPVPLPDPVLDVLRDEAGRVGVTPGSLACDIIREALPAWVHRRLSEALRPVLDAEEDDRTPLPTLRSGSHAATPPTGGGATDISISTGCTVTDTLAPGDPAKGPPGDAAA